MANRKFRTLVFLFLAMYAVATVLGFATYLLISPLAMWIGVFTAMPVVATWLMRRYLLQIRCSPDSSLRETMVLVAFGSAFRFFWMHSRTSSSFPTAARSLRIGSSSCSRVRGFGSHTRFCWAAAWRRVNCI
jgi:hypothetical protein